MVECANPEQHRCKDYHALEDRVTEAEYRADRWKQDRDFALGEMDRLAALGNQLAAAVEAEHRKHTTHIAGGVVAPGPKGPTYMKRVPTLEECHDPRCQAGRAWRAAREA